MLTAKINADLSLEYSGQEALNTVCSNLTFSAKNVRRVVVTSCEANDGKTFMAIQIVANMASRGKRVILVDADLRLSVLTGHYEIDLEGKKCGLAHFLSGQCALEECVYQTNIPNMYLLPAGNEVSNPMGLISTPDFKQMLETLADNFDLVIVDAPPIGMVIDAAEIARFCDGSIFVLEYNKTHRRELKQACLQMQQSGTPVLGYVLNKVTFDRLSTKQYYYHYSSRYKYHKYGKYGRYGKYGKYGKEISENGYYRKPHSGFQDNKQE